MQLRFASAWPWWCVVMLAVLGAILIARWYWRETHSLSRPWNILLPCLRAMAFGMLILMMLRPSLHDSWIEGELSQVVMLIDTSASMATVDEQSRGQNKEAISRIERVQQWLLPEGNDQASRLDMVSRYHRLRIGKLDQETIWDSVADKSVDPIRSLEAQEEQSPIGEAMQNVYRSLVLDEQSSDVKQKDQANQVDAIVIVSDGQSNGTIAPLDLVSQGMAKKIPIIAIGLGKTNEPDDLAILGADVSRSIRREDLLRGTLRIKEQIAEGIEYRTKIKSQGVVVFEKTIVGAGRGVFELDFDIPASLLMDRVASIAGPTDGQRAIPIDLECTVDSQSNEHTLVNNRLVTSTWGVLRENRALMLDPRGRWETRYIRNALDRDPSWELVSSLGPGAFRGTYFPKSRSELLKFDLVIATADVLSHITEEQGQWLSDMVGDSGGGLIWIQDSRSPSVKKATLGGVLPFLDASEESRSNATVPTKIESQLRLTAIGLRQPALQLDEDGDSNQTIWQGLPGPRATKPIGVKPGVEVLVENQRADRWYPMIATMIFGQGRVAAFSTDETWRWRYNVADVHHQRFWNQFANWVMRTPFVVSDTFASIDAGKRVYAANESVAIRARLVNNDQQPFENGVVHAVFSQEGRRLASLPLTEQSEGTGLYTGEFSNLVDWTRFSDFDSNQEVKVQLEAVGIPAEALQISTSFFVEKGLDIESTTLACNREMLQQLADRTGGAFLPIEQADSLEELLKSHRRGTLKESSWHLWQSYPWFAAIIIVLALEWFLRKRHGLV